MGSPLISELHAAGPASDQLAAFGRIIGEWELDWRGATVDGDEVSSRGTLAAGWVLGGRAVQDVWRVPPAVPGDLGIAGTGFHGSTIRFFDPRIDAWRSTWMEPINGRVRKFVGKERDESIVLLSVDGDPHLRWTFRDLRADGFTWVGEFSGDGGHSWAEEERMYARRTDRS